MTSPSLARFRLWIFGIRRVLAGLVFAVATLPTFAATPASPIQSASEYDYPPFSIVTKDGQASGFSVELLREALRAVGRDVQFKVGPWHLLKQELAEGRIQVLPLVGRNAERKLLYDFTAPYISMHGTLYVRKGDSRIRGLQDLQGKTLLVLKGDIAEEYAREHKLTDKIATTETYDAAFRQLADGQHDALLVQKLVGETLIQKLGLTNLETAGPPIEHYQDFCFAVRLGDKELLATLNEGLALIIANGTVERLREKWIAPTRDEAYANLRHNLSIVLGVLLLGGFPAFIVHRSKLAEVNRRATQAKQSEMRFRSYFHLPLAGIAITSPEKGWIEVNEHLCKMLGYSKDELTRMTWAELTHPDDITADVAQFERVLRGEVDDYALDKRFIRKDGTVIPVSLSVRCVRTEDGSANYFVALLHDISEKKRAEASQALLAEITSQAAEGVSLVKASDGTFIYTNRHFDKIFGYKEGELIGQPVTVINAPGEASPAETAASIIRRLETAGVWDGEVLSVKKDGTLFWTNANVSTFTHAEFGTVWITHQSDITDRKKAELELHDLNEQLETRIVERTHELALAKEAAEAANIAKSAFLANMSHEIRTPMNGIIGMANVLRREGVTSKQSQRLDTIDASAQHLLSVINDVLDISKIEAGKFTMEEAPVVVSSLMANVSSILSERVKAKGIHLLIETEHLPHNLMGDPTRLQQALLNYATNAVKFTEKGTVTLRALKQEETADSVRVRFEVTDTGIGIASEAMSRLFSAFEQADNSMTRKYGGTGLGLAITRRLAELMDGETGADSMLGAGSTFWFTVKLKKMAERRKAARLEKTEKEDAETLLKLRYFGQRILVVDDEPVNREVALMQFEAVDLVADTAADGAEAVAMARGNSYAAIFMDMQMPKLNGVEATQEIRQLPGYRDTPIIAMTANAFAEDKTQCMDAGMTDFLSKPFNPDQLFAVLLRSLDRQEK